MKGTLLKSTAHLVVHLKSVSNRSLPVVVRVDVYSSGPRSLTGQLGLTAAEILSMEADSFAEAKKLVLEAVKNSPGLQWAWPWLDTSRAAYEDRYELYKKLQGELEGSSMPSVGAPVCPSHPEGGSCEPMRDEPGRCVYGDHAVGEGT